MNIYERLYDEMKSAMKAKDQKKVLLFRGLISNIKNATINAGKEITDDNVISCIKKNIKEIDQSIESFAKANRNDDVASLKNDKAYLQTFLPAQMNITELQSIVEASIKKLNATSKKDMGKVIKDVLMTTNEKADGKSISAIVAKMLG